jgi:ABC-type nickel/cobalt efflux system permease component RcnA
MTKPAPSRPTPDTAENAAVKGVGSGLLGGLLACLPCFPPALALLLGLGGSTAFITLAQYEPVFQLAGFVLTLVVAAWLLRHRVRASRRDRSQVPALLLAIGTYVVAYLALAYVVTPLLYQLYARR